MLTPAFRKACMSAAPDNPVLKTEGRVTLVDAYLAGAASQPEHALPEGVPARKSDESQTSDTIGLPSLTC